MNFTSFSLLCFLLTEMCLAHFTRYSKGGPITLGSRMNVPSGFGDAVTYFGGLHIHRYFGITCLCWTGVHGFTCPQRACRNMGVGIGTWMKMIMAAWMKKWMNSMENVPVPIWLMCFKDGSAPRSFIGQHLKLFHKLALVVMLELLSNANTSASRFAMWL
jgi:hypothetical protein